MTANFHTHSTFSDGNNTPEEIILYAIENNFSAIGFSDHGYTSYDLRYCMQDTKGYISEINRLKEKYRDKIEIYLGTEEDAFQPADRKNYDYIIGSCHYFCIDSRYYPIDSSYDYFKACCEAFNYDIIKMADTYYRRFTDYIKARKPDIIGHFDLITKFSEKYEPDFLESQEYTKIAEKYLLEALKADCIFEVNTGALARGIRTSPYPYENLLYIIKNTGGKIILSSDSHSAETLNFGFEDTKSLLKDIGFDGIYTLSNGSFKKELF